MSASEGKQAMAQGRIVWASGDLFKGKLQTIYGTNMPKLNQKTGLQDIQYGFGLAIPVAELSDPVRGALWIAMHEEAYTMFPSRQIPQAFAMKYKDGTNGIDENGQPYNLREGYNGCLVFALTTNLVIRYFKWENGQNIQISEGIKCGDYVNVQVNVKAHPASGAGKAGLYLNPMVVQLVVAGKEIRNAPTGDQVFGVGAPGAPSNYVPPEQPVMPPMGAPPAPMGFAPPPAAQPAAPAPHHAVLPPQFQPPPGGMPAAYPPAPAAYPQAAPAMPAPGGYPMPAVPR